jgi:hypothetical protein
LLLPAFDQVAQDTQILKLVADVSHFLVEPGRCTTNRFLVRLGFRSRIISLNLDSSLLFALDNLFHLTLILKPINIPAKKQEHTLQPDNHIIPGTACTEAIPLTKWTQAILIKRIFIILFHTKLAKLSLADVFIVYNKKVVTDFGVGEVGVAATSHEAIGQFGLFEFDDLGDVGVVVGGGGDGGTVFGGVVLALDEVRVGVDEFAVVADVELVELLRSLALRKVLPPPPHLLTDVPVPQGTRLVPVLINPPEPKVLRIRQQVHSGK